MNLARLYSQLIGTCEERNGKPSLSFGNKKANRNPGYEIHHIMPRSLGGSDEPHNLVYFTPREHFIAHRLLARLYGGSMWFAFMRMCNSGGKYHYTSQTYELARKNQAEQIAIVNTGSVLTEEHKAKIGAFFKGRKKPQEAIEKTRQKLTGRSRPQYVKDAVRAAKIGKKHTAEHNKKISQSLIGNTRTLGYKHRPESIEKMREAMTGRTFEDDHKSKISDALKKHNASLPPVTCEHCGKTVADLSYKRWHGSRCKYKP